MIGSAASKKQGTSIRLFLVDGTPEGLTIVEKSNWTGVAAVSARAQYPQVRARDEFSRPGVYVLIGSSDGESVLPRIYIGEADVPRKRLDSHLAAKDFWTRLILFSSKDGSLHKAHSKYLEARLVQLAHLAKRADLENGNVPQAPALVEADAADAEAFLNDMLLIFPVLQVNAFELPADSGPSSERLYLEGPDAKGVGKETAEGFLVYADSRARKATVPSIHSYLVQLREKLLEQGILAEDGAVIRLTQNYVFNSPSSAAAVLLGRSANGRTEWKDMKGRTLKELAALAVSDG